MRVDPADDLTPMRLAARAALRAAGDVEPNPLVGAAIVNDGRVIGLGHHRRFGGPHAEREALADAAARGHDVRGSTLYCTLEPCGHYGKTPPCADAVIAAGVARVVYARADEHPRARGGAAMLRAAGVDAVLDPRCALAARLTDPFVTRLRLGRPYVIAKWAQTIDGRIATATGESRWISSVACRRRVHRLRARVDAILTGVGTVLRDDPLMNARGVPRTRRVARRVVLDSSARTPLGAQLVATARSIPTTVFCTAPALVSDAAAAARAEALEQAGVQVVRLPAMGDRPDLRRAIAYLAQAHDATSVLVEAGPTIIGGLLAADLIDQCVVYVSPRIMGDAAAPPAVAGLSIASLDAMARFDLARVKRLGSEIELTYVRPA